jgi:hypothetical protein
LPAGESFLGHDENDPHKVMSRTGSESSIF